MWSPSSLTARTVANAGPAPANLRSRLYNTAQCHSNMRSTATAAHQPRGLEGANQAQDGPSGDRHRYRSGAHFTHLIGT